MRAHWGGQVRPDATAENQDLHSSFWLLIGKLCKRICEIQLGKLVSSIKQTDWSWKMTLCPPSPSCCTSCWNFSVSKRHYKTYRPNSTLSDKTARSLSMNVSKIILIQRVQNVPMMFEDTVRDRFISQINDGVIQRLLEAKFIDNPSLPVLADSHYALR